jgi:hypothetical protein
MAVLNSAAENSIFQKHLVLDNPCIFEDEQSKKKKKVNGGDNSASNLLAV